MNCAARRSASSGSRRAFCLAMSKGGRRYRSPRSVRENQDASSMQCGMSSRHLRRHCELDPPSRRLLSQAIERLGLSARAHDRILKVSRTIADLGAYEQIESAHVAEAVQYRALDRAYFR